MSYNAIDWQVENLWVIPKYFFTQSVVERRKPLSNHARRAGWVGCNILYQNIPKQERIDIIHEGRVIEKEEVLANVKQASCLFIGGLEARGWLLDVLNCLNCLPQEMFSLQEVYQFEHVLQTLHPNNDNVRLRYANNCKYCGTGEFWSFWDRGTIEGLIVVQVF